MFQLGQTIEEPDYFRIIICLLKCPYSAQNHQNLYKLWRGDSEVNNLDLNDIILNISMFTICTKIAFKSNKTIGGASIHLLIFVRA